MKARQRLYIISAVFALFLCAPYETLGCSCVAERPACEAFGSAKAVFVGKVTGAKQQRQQKNPDGTTTTYQVGEIYFNVEQGFLGAKTSQVVIHSGTGGGDCGYWFIKGRRYLIYAYGESTDKLGTSICTRTRLLDSAEEDLSFLRTMPQKGLGVRIYGTVVAALRDPKSPDWRTPKPLSGITVKVAGKQSFETVTGADGGYELTNLPPGTYKVSAEVPDYYRRGSYWVREIQVADRGCAQVGFFAENDSRITGRVLRLDGTGLPKASVQLIPVDAEDKSIGRIGLDVAFANESGEFALDQVAPGRYLLGVNLTSSPDKEAPFPRTYYPGTSDRSKAAVIEVGLGEKLSGIDIQLPPNLAEYLIRGFVIWPDGALAAGVQVYVEDVNQPGWCVNGCSHQTDAQGQFELRGYSGYNYRVLSTANKRVGKGEGQDVYGKTSPFLLASDTEGLKILLSKPGRPWDNKTSEPSESKPPK